MRQRDKERGFALLLVFALAAAAGIMLYREMPRAVFESARAKEDLLVERGEQYKLAIRRYYTKIRKYPQTIDELEQTNGTRFLRRRYKDPMTGEDEWRLIHIGPAGFTDSKVHKPAQATTEQKEVRQSSISEGYQVGGGNFTTPEQEKGMQGVAMRQRASDQLPAGQNREAQPGEPPPPPGEVGANQPGTGNPQTAGNQPGLNTPGMPGAPGVQQGTPGIQPGTQGVQPGTPGVPGAQPGAQQGTQGQQQNNPALGLIQQQLTTARQGPTPGTGTGTNPGMGATPQQGGGFSGGIAGVASKYKGEGIKLINERSKIEEWEFLFDYRQQQNVVGQNGQPGQPGRTGMGGPPGQGGLGSGGSGSSNFGSSGGGSFGGLQGSQQPGQTRTGSR